MAPSAVIFGCQGPELTYWEKAFFADSDPLGFILFARNCGTPDQVRALVREMRASVGRADAPVLIDQEGGRVARLKPPHWRNAPAPQLFDRMCDDQPDQAERAAELNAMLVASELVDLGIDVDCWPVLDVPISGAHDVIGDRAFGSEPQRIIKLASATVRGLSSLGVMPIIKHIPGHGRALVDSHLDLPAVECDLSLLENTDFVPFHALRDVPWAMTGHMVFKSIDPDRPVTTSKTVIDQIIRGKIAYAGLLITDDLSMKALSGDFTDRARDALAAGCDILLHCNGDAQEMMAVARASQAMGRATQDRFRKAKAWQKARKKDVDLASASAELNSLLGQL
ncbi:MAG: beta-N-acetylhexosaminidase [Pseudomonadota bacterium]